MVQGANNNMLYNPILHCWPRDKYCTLHDMYMFIKCEVYNVCVKNISLLIIWSIIVSNTCDCTGSLYSWASQPRWWITRQYDCLLWDRRHLFLLWPLWMCCKLSSISLNLYMHLPGMQEVVGSNPTWGSSFFLEKGKMGCLRCCCVVCHLYCLITLLLSTGVHVHIQCIYITYVYV